MLQVFKPMLAETAAVPFSSPDWSFEIKWDGIRCLAVLNKSVNLYSRTGRNLTSVYPEVITALPKAFRASDVVLDGELVVLDDLGRSNYNAIQHRIGLTPAHPLAFAMALKQYPVVFYIFDLIRVNHMDMTRQTLRERRRLLQAKLNKNDTIRFSDALIGDGKGLFQQAKASGIEGIMAKRLSSPYALGARSANWLKIKCRKELDAVVLGWTNPEGSRQCFGAVVMGLYDEQTRRYTYIGRVGTGFAEHDLKMLSSRFTPLFNRDHYDCPSTLKNVHWVEPTIIVRVKYASITPHGILREPVFIGVRDDVSLNFE